MPTIVATTYVISLSGCRLGTLPGTLLFNFLPRLTAGSHLCYLRCPLRTYVHYYTAAAIDALVLVALA